ncbi:MULTISPECIES: pantothenate kinase [unclassified Synechocystis]|uniref:pantothenate kinase n=1 Tax=unclassified Synechocystis TaxID=2640012 RepID=UPI0004016EED|nr:MULTISPECIES: pantothenate kinase [unclassified Synechocystis]AIE75967.1 Pantothenate kinase type III, CoaX-like [Synechocystis sp. PCC 6714]
MENQIQGFDLALNNHKQKLWLALMIGNSRLHWAYCSGNTPLQTWATNYSPALEQFPVPLEKVPLVLASVVPEQTQAWHKYQPRILTLADLPLKNLYPSFGIDRALAALGAGLTYDFPCVVIDGGTALTITGFDQDKKLVGGAILPGLGLQLQTLGDRLAVLPHLTPSSTLPDLWARDTLGAMLSGVTYSILGALQTYLWNWQKLFPGSAMVFTGGDGNILYAFLKKHSPELLVNNNDDLIFLGMAAIQHGDRAIC